MIGFGCAFRIVIRFHYMLTGVAVGIRVHVLRRMVKDKTTQKLKGTAFVEFERPEDAERAAAACAKAR